MKKYLMMSGFLAMLLAVAVPAIGQEETSVSKVLFTNANIFDGQSAALAPGMSVLVEGNKIAKIGKSIAAPAGATVIDTNGAVETCGGVIG